MKYFLTAMIILSLTGCGKADQLYAHYTGDASETCHDGVMYLQFTSGASVKYTRDGKIATCN